MFATTRVGVLAGYLADLALGDPKRGHPVAVFGRAAARLERLTYRDSRIAGVAHVGLLLGALALLGTALQRAAGRGSWSIAATAAATWISLGGTSLARTGVSMAELAGARRRGGGPTAVALAVRARPCPAG